MSGRRGISLSLDPAGSRAFIRVQLLRKFKNNERDLTAISNQLNISELLSQEILSALLCSAVLRSNLREECHYISSIARQLTGRPIPQTRSHSPRFMAGVNHVIQNFWGRIWPRLKKARGLDEKLMIISPAGTSYGQPIWILQDLVTRNQHPTCIPFRVERSLILPLGRRSAIELGIGY